MYAYSQSDDLTFSVKTSFTLPKNNVYMHERKAGVTGKVTLSA